MKYRSHLIVLILLPTLSFSQSNKLLKGILVDKGDSPIMGCNVFIKGTTVGAVTDLCGEFELNAEQEAFTISFSCTTSDLKTFEIQINPKEISESEKIIFKLKEHWKMKNKECNKFQNKGLKKYIIN